MSPYPQCTSLGDISVRRFARAAVEMAAEGAVDAFKRHARMACAMFRTFMPYSEKIAELSDMGRVVLTDILVNRRNCDGECFRKAKERVEPDRL